MLTRWIDLCLRNPAVVLLATTLLVVLGISSLHRLPVDAFPDTTSVQVQINTTAPALSPLEIEGRVTFPTEQAITGMPGLEEVRSSSKFGFSQVTAIFDDETDIYLARQLVGERLANVELPPSAVGPTLGPIATGLGEVFQYLVHSDDLDTQELRTLHHWVIRPQMLQVPGVAEINTWGGYEKQYHVVVDPLRLIQFDLTLDDVARVLANGNRNVGGGLVNRGGESLLIQGHGLATSLEDLQAMVVATAKGNPIHLSSVAQIREDHEIRRGGVTAGGKGEAVLGLGFMLAGENSRKLTRRLESRLNEVRGTLPQGVDVTPVYSRTTLVDAVLETVLANLVEGALLVVAILFAFLGNFRAGFIVALAIPLSMLFAFSGMLYFGIAGSLMSLGAIDFGLVVDSSLIMVENAAHRIETDTSKRSIEEIVRDAVVEVRRPTLLGELVIAIVYLPILTLEGVEGKLFRPMALTVILALMGSMLVSVTLMPVLANLMLRRGATGANSFTRKLRTIYAPILEWTLANRRVVLSCAALTVLLAGLLTSQLGTDFLPRLQERSVVINTVRMAGVSLDESIRYGTLVEKKLLKAFPEEIANIWTRTGTAEVATDPMGLEVSDVFVTLTDTDQWTRHDSQEDLVRSMATELDGLPGMRSIFTQPIEMRMNEMVAGIRSDVGIKLFGDDFSVLKERGEAIRERVQQIAGSADVTLDQISGQPMLAIEVDREAAGRLGIPTGDVLALIESLGSRKIGEVVEDEQRRFDVIMRIDREGHNSRDAIESILIHSPSGEQFPLSAVATFNIVEGPATIQREWAKRRITVQANVRGRDVGSFVAELRQVLAADVEIPTGYFIRIGGQFEHLERARNRLMLVVPIALLLVFILLYITYGRAIDALRVFTGVPFAAVGGVLALWARDMSFSISAGVGFVALSGVAVLGDMVLVSRVRQLEGQGIESITALREGAKSRLRPVLMTAMVAALGFVPMALASGVGSEVQRPLATVVVGGIITATLSTLLVLPALYAAVTRRRDS